MLIRLAIIGFYCVLVAFAGHAETFEVKMLNKGKSGKMVFEPDFVLIGALLWTNIVQNK